MNENMNMKEEMVKKDVEELYSYKKYAMECTNELIQRK